MVFQPTSHSPAENRYFPRIPIDRIWLPYIRIRPLTSSAFLYSNHLPAALGSRLSRIIKYISHITSRFYRATIFHIDTNPLPGTCIFPDGRVLCSDHRMTGHTWTYKSCTWFMNPKTREVKMDGITATIGIVTCLALAGWLIIHTMRKKTGCWSRCSG